MSRSCWSTSRYAVVHVLPAIFSALLVAATHSSGGGASASPPVLRRPPDGNTAVQSRQAHGQGLGGSPCGLQWGLVCTEVLLNRVPHDCAMCARESQESLYSESATPAQARELASGLHRTSAERRRCAVLASPSGPPGRCDNTPVLTQSCRVSSVRSATLRAPTRSAWRTSWHT